jgi:putative transposase
MISFKGAQLPKDVIRFAVFFYVSYTVSYPDLEEILREREAQVDHATLNGWVARYSPLIAANARHRKAPTDRSWRMDETYIRVKGEWVYLYRAVDKYDKTLEFAARTFGSCCQNGATNRP